MEKIEKIEDNKEKTDAENTSKINHFRKKKEYSYNKNNHSMRFSKYMPRKNNIYSTNKVVSYIQPYDYVSAAKNKTIDFNKMLTRSEKVLINVSSLQVPSFCSYTPKYDLLEKTNVNYI